MILGIMTPVLLFLIFAWIFSGSGSQAPVLSVGWVDLDRSRASFALERLLESDGVVRPFTEASVPLLRENIPLTAGNVETLIRTGKISLAVVVEPGLGNQVQYFRKWRSSFIRVLYDPGASMQADILKGLLTKAGFLLMSQTLTSGSDKAAYAGVDPRLRRFAVDLRRAFQESNAYMGEKRSSSVTESFLPISVEEVRGGRRVNVAAAQQLAGVAVIFLLFSVSRAGGVLLEEKQSGTLKRILTSPISPRGFMLGKLFAVSLNGIVQISVVALAGCLAFGIPIFHSPLALLLIIAATAVCAASFGMVFATFCQTSEQVLATATFVILAMSLVGGSMVPEFLLPAWAQKLSVLTLNGWAMTGFLNVLARGAGTLAIIPQLAALLAMSAIFLGAAFSILPRRLYE